MTNMNAETLGFSFATRVADSFGSSVATQEAKELPMGERPVRQATARRRASSEKLSPTAASTLTASGLLEHVEPSHNADDIIISSTNYKTLAEIVQETRRAEDLRRHGLRPRSKVLFCGPPGCGKTLCAEIVAAELRAPLLVARLDAIITTYLGETASNLRKVFDAVANTNAVLFLDEFDALARARTDASEHSEIRRVVNSLLMMIDRFEGRGILIAATNLANTIDEAAWRRFDDVLIFEKPTERQVAAAMRLKLRNFKTSFDPSVYAKTLVGLSFADVERICLRAIKRSILSNLRSVTPVIFEEAIDTERRRAALRSSGA